MAPDCLPQRMLLSALDVQEHIDDYTWLDEHINEVFQQIRDGLNDDSRLMPSINLLNAVMPYALTRIDYRRWDSLLYDALLHVINAQDTENQIQIWSHLGSSYLQYGRYKSASEVFEKALDRTDYVRTHEIKLLARVGMLRAQAIFQTSDIRQFIKDTLKEAQDIVNYHVLGRLHFALALTYTHQGETVQALGHCQIALCCWQQLNNLTEVERCALLLAEACRVARLFSQAERFLQLVEPSTGDTYKRAIYCYQQGALMLEQNQLPEAQSWFNQALTLYQQLPDFPYFTAASHHALGLVETKLEIVDSARRNLRRALILWQDMDNRLQQVNAAYALGFLEERVGNKVIARQLYQKAYDASGSLPTSPMRDELRQELEKQLNNLSE